MQIKKLQTNVLMEELLQNWISKNMGLLKSYTFSEKSGKKFLIEVCRSLFKHFAVFYSGHGQHRGTLHFQLIPAMHTKLLYREALISFLHGFKHVLSFLFWLNSACPGLSYSHLFHTLWAFCKYSAKSQAHLHTPGPLLHGVCWRAKHFSPLTWVGGSRGEVLATDQIKC